VRRPEALSEQAVALEERHTWTPCQASQLKSEFVAALSHDIRTPTTAVIGMTGLAARHELSPKHYELAETVRTSAENGC